MNREIAGTVVSVNEEGYLTDLSQWTRDVALELAKAEGIELTDQHWTVIEYIQQSFRNSESLSIRSLGKRGPLKKASKIAGIPKPVSCI
jgi:TusE/DsrC/DsvC family sulfur relay protein